MRVPSLRVLVFLADWALAPDLHQLVHKERSIRSKLSKEHCGELARLFKRLRESQGKSTTEEVVSKLEEFLQGKNAEACQSLDEAGDDLIALHRSGVPSTRHRNLLSTKITRGHPSVVFSATLQGYRRLVLKPLTSVNQPHTKDYNPAGDHFSLHSRILSTFQKTKIFRLTS